MQANHFRVKFALTIVLLYSSLGAFAGEQFSNDAGTPANSVAINGFGVPLGDAHLQAYRGGFDNVKNDLQLSGSVAENLARNVTTGSNYIADGSFVNTTGFPLVIQNSGANVLIQNATIINLQY